MAGIEELRRIGHPLFEYEKRLFRQLPIPLLLENLVGAYPLTQKATALPVDECEAG
jgi:hypothetical protein